MKKILALITVLAGMAAVFTGCSVNIQADPEEITQILSNPEVSELADMAADKISINITTEAVTGNQNTADNQNAANSQASSDTQAAAVNAESSSDNNAAAENTASSRNSGKYAYSDDIKLANAEASKNPDGSIRITFENGKFAVTLPAELENHFVLTDNGQLTSKVFYEKHDGWYGKMAGFGCTDYINYYVATPLGKVGSEYMHAFRATDSDYKPYDPDYPEANEEFDLIDSNLGKIYSSSESYNENTGKMERIFEVKDTDGSRFHGHIDIRDKSEQLCGIVNDDFIYGNVSKENSRKWPVEDGWHVYVTRAVALEDGTYFDCYDSDDNDHYGWIHCYNLELENNGYNAAK